MEMQGIVWEYQRNVAALDLRVVQLQRLLGTTRQQETRRRIQKRIGLLRAMAGEGRRTAYDMQHYYDKEAAQWHSAT